MTHVTLVRFFGRYKRTLLTKIDVKKDIVTPGGGRPRLHWRNVHKTDGTDVN